MSGVGRTSRPPFVYGLAFILLYSVSQFTRPFLTDFKTVSDDLVRYEIRKDKSKYEYDYLVIWIGNKQEPFVNQYPRDYEHAIRLFDELIETEITLWYDSNREIFQITDYKGTKIIKYSWINYWLFIILVLGLFFHIAAYLETKKKTNNINSYWNMWDYVVGGRTPIMKHNNQPYDPDDVINLSWFDNIFKKK